MASSGILLTMCLVQKGKNITLEPLLTQKVNGQLRTAAVPNGLLQLILYGFPSSHMYEWKTRTFREGGSLWPYGVGSVLVLACPVRLTVYARPVTCTTQTSSSHNAATFRSRRIFFRQEYSSASTCTHTKTAAQIQNWQTSPSCHLPVLSLARPVTCTGQCVVQVTGQAYTVASLQEVLEDIESVFTFKTTFYNVSWCPPHVQIDHSMPNLQWQHLSQSRRTW